MAKPKKYITSKLKVKRKFVDGGPYSDTESELYLGKNTYSADMGPTNQMQAQANLEEQQQKQAQQVYNSSKAQVINAQTDLNKNQELERQRAEEEKQIQEAENKQIEQNMQKQVTSAAGLAGKEIAKTVATTSTATKLPTDAAGAVLSKADAKALGVKSAGRFAGQGVSKFSYGSSLANLGVGLGFGLAGEGLGYWAKRRQDKIDTGRGYSDYYSDTHYTNREALGQVGKSTLKGAGMGSAFGPVGSAIGAGVGLLYGAGKAVHEKRKASGKNWFGESNVYDENKDPNVIAKKQYEDSLEAQARISSQMDNAFLSSRVTNQNTGHGLTNTIMARTGGKIEYLKGGVAKSLGRGAKEYVGKSHEQGGIDLPGNIEVEGGETEQNNYIFSKHLKLHTGISYAQAHKNLLKSGASGEEIHQLALSQEAAAGRNPNQIKGMKFAKYGGPLEYKRGGKKKGNKTSEEPNYFTSGQFAADQATKGPETISKGRTKEYWQNLEERCLLDPFAEGCTRFDEVDESPNLAGKFAAKRNAMNKNIALGEEVPTNFMNKDFTPRTINSYSDYVNAMKFYDQAQTMYARPEYGVATNELYNKDLLPNLTQEEFEFYKRQRNNPDIQSYVTDERLKNKDDGRLATPRPITADEYEFYQREKAAREANETRQASEYGPMLKGKDMTTLPRKQAQLAQYNLPNITVNNTSTFVPDEVTNQDANYKAQITDAIAKSGLSVEEFAKQNGLSVDLLKGIQSGSANLSADEAALITSSLPVNGTGYMQAVPGSYKPATNNNPTTTTTTTTTNNPPANTNANSNAPTINNQLSTFENIAQTEGALDFTKPDVAGGIWAGNRYEEEWKPLVARTMSDDFNADKVISYLENYSGQDAADVKARIAGKSRDEQIKIINELATDKQVGPFHNAVLEGINSTKDYGYMKGKDPKPFPINPPTIKPYNPVTKPPLPNPPEYKDPNLGWTQAIPAIAALGTNIKPANYAPAMAAQYVQPGSVGKANIGRVQFNEQQNDLRANTSAMTQALQNVSGPAAIAGMLAAKTKSDQQSLAIANAEQNQNMALAAKEGELNAGISKFNVGSGMQAQTTNAGIGVQNAAMRNEASKFNAASKFQADVDNRDTKLSAGQHAIDSYLTYDMDKRKLAATERVARAQDYTGALNREQKYADLKRASKDPNNKDFYGKTEAELWDYARQYDKQMYGDRGNVVYADANKDNKDQKKFGGAKKYVSRLGDLKNAKYKV